MGVGDLTVAEARLIQGLFVPRERWGWQFVDADPPTPSPVADHRPIWEEPAPPDLSELAARRDRAVKALWTRLPLPVAFVVLGLVLAGEGGLFFVPAGLVLAALAVLPPIYFSRRLRRVRTQAATAKTRAFALHQHALDTWQAEVDAHEQAEQQRRAATDRYFPVSTPAATPRIDVFGGSGDGWASLLATAGSSVLSRGSGILLVDLSERMVGGGLARLAAQARWPVESWDLPRQIDEVALLDGLEPEVAGELVADAFDMTRGDDEDPHRRSLHADLITTVSHVLRDALSFRRLAEGLRILEGLDDGSASVSLSPAESGELAAYMDSFGRGDRIADELRYLRSSLEALSPPQPIPPPEPAAAWPDGGNQRRLGTWWPVPGLRVFATSSRASSARRKELADRLLVQAVLHQLRRRELGASNGALGGPAHGQDMLVVAGADHLGRIALDGLARHAEIAGVRLVLLFERLAEDSERLLGSQGGSTIIMRLGNGKDAATAAEFIGRGYRFVLSQVTAQVGRSFTAGDSDSSGYQDGTSFTDGTSGGNARTYDGTRILPWLVNTSKNTGWQESVTTSRSETWQRTTNYSVSDSTTDGTTSARVYEFTVEPTTVQTLPTTAFLLVNPIDGPGRVIPGDCNPGTILLPGVSPVDRWTAHYTAGLPTPDLPGAVHAGGDGPREIESVPLDDSAYRLTPPTARPAQTSEAADRRGAPGWVPPMTSHHRAGPG